MVLPTTITTTTKTYTTATTTRKIQLLLDKVTIIEDEKQILK